MSDQDKSPASILIVDDDKSTKAVLSILLRDRGFTVGTASNGTEALEHLKNQNFDIIITDLCMPGIDGFKLLDIVKTEHREHKVMIMSSNVEQRMKFLHRGAMEALEKPVTLEQFVDTLTWLIRERRKSRRFEDIKKPKGERYLNCVITETGAPKKYQGLLHDISVDGALIEVDQDLSRLKQIDIEISLTEKSHLVFKLTGTIVRIIPLGTAGWQVAVYFDNDRDLSFVEKLAPFIKLKDKEKA